MIIIIYNFHPWIVPYYQHLIIWKFYFIFYNNIDFHFIRWYIFIQCAYKICITRGKNMNISFYVYRKMWIGHKSLSIIYIQAHFIDFPTVHSVICKTVRFIRKFCHFVFTYIFMATFCRWYILIHIYLFCGRSIRVPIYIFMFNEIIFNKNSIIFRKLACFAEKIFLFNFISINTKFHPQTPDERTPLHPVELSTELMLACTVALSPSNSLKQTHPKVLERLPDLIR